MGRTLPLAAAERCFDEAREAHERSRPVREAAIANEEHNVQNLRQEAAG